MNSNKICIITDTPYQIFNAIIYYYKIDKAKDAVDFFYDVKYSYTSTVVERIRACHLFENCIQYTNEPREKHRNIEYYINRIHEIHSPLFNIENSVNGTYDPSCQKYEKIICFAGIRFVLDMIRTHPEADVILVEEGTASFLYQNLLADEFLNSIGKKDLFFKMLGEDVKKIKADNMYLYDPNLYKFSPQTYPILKLPRINNNDYELISILEKVFKESNHEQYSGKKIIYLTQPMQYMAENYEFVDDKVLETLQKYKKIVVVKPHPAQDLGNFLDFETDKSHSFWELLVKDVVDDNTILISPSSTAMITPKTIYGKEPHVIFTYGMYKMKSSDVRNFSLCTDIAVDMYSNKEKVHRPITINEFEKALTDCLDNLA